MFVTAIYILDIIHCRVFYLKRNASETGFCLLLQVVFTGTRLDQRDGASPCLWRQGDTIQSPKHCLKD
jgi:hypothetical protein